MTSTPTQLSPRHGADLVNLAKDVVKLLLKRPNGVHQDDFLNTHFGGNPPTSATERDFYWDEFKRAVQYSNAMFDLKEAGWGWIRALRGVRRGQFYYMLVALVEKGDVQIKTTYPTSEQLEEQTDKEWNTRTRSRMRVKVADAQAKIATGMRELVLEGERDLDDIILISTRLASINFDAGMSMEDLRQLANPNDRRLNILVPAIKRALKSAERAQRDINELATTVLGLKTIMTHDRPMLGQGAGRIDRVKGSQP